MKVGRWVLSALSLALLHVPAQAEEPLSLTTPRERMNYAIGVNVISNLRQQGVEVDVDLVTQGMRDAAAGGKYKLSDEDIRIAIQQYQLAVRQRRPLVLSREAMVNKKDGEAFLEKNRTAAGVTPLPSGLQYKVIKAGTGGKPTADDTVEVNLRGTLVDGTEFVSSGRTGAPATLVVKTALPGIAEALILMPTGSTWQLFIPPQLAYGERGKPAEVGPNATLIYEIELLGIK